MKFYNYYKYKNREYRFDDSGISLGFFVDNKYSDTAENGFVPQGKRITPATEKLLIESGGFEPFGEVRQLDEEIENKNEKSKWGGKREGAGRKEGSRNSNTIEDNIAKEEMRQRVIKSVGSLMNSQMNLAKGCQLLFKIVKKGEKPILVVNQKEIENYLAGEYEENKDEYYFITTKVPDNKAIDSLFDRTFGKARQNIGLDGGEDGKPISIEAKEKSKKAIDDYLKPYDNPTDTTGGGQEANQISIPVQSEE
ncbi:MAG: hypothetical protein U9Q97_09875 [Acidobacteriota bacterium]|nr:hypothetical protein [Acidobacteriota bacterium]